MRPRDSTIINTNPIHTKQHQSGDKLITIIVMHNASYDQIIGVDYNWVFNA